METEKGVWLAVQTSIGGPQTKVWVLMKDLSAFLAAARKEEATK